MSRVPRIRFKGFEEDWEQRKVGAICSISTGKSNTQDRVEDGKYPFYVRSPIVECSNRYLFDEEAVLTVGDGVGTGKVFHYVDGKYDLHQRVYRMFDFGKDITAKYFFYYFSNNFYNRVIAMTAKTSVDSVRYEMIAGMDICTPSIKEQKFVSELFESLDHLITLHQRKLGKLKIIKKSMLENLFPENGEKTPRIRFSGFTEDWEQRKLGEVAAFSKGCGYSKSDLKDSGIPVILYGRLYTNYETVIKEVDTFVDCIGGAVYSKGGEIITPSSGETSEDISIASVVEKSGILLGGDLNIIYPQNLLDSIFIAISISNGKPHKDMAKRAQGKSVVHLHNGDLAQIEIDYPSIDEQTRISSYFQSLDHLITLHQSKLEKLQKIKKSMLESMFV